MVSSGMSGVVIQYVLVALQGFFWLALGVGALVAAFAFNRLVTLKETCRAGKLGGHAGHGGPGHHGGHHAHTHHGHGVHGGHGHGGCGCGGHGEDESEESDEGNPAVELTPFID